MLAIAKLAKAMIATAKLAKSKLAKSQACESKACKTSAYKSKASHNNKARKTLLGVLAPVSYYILWHVMEGRVARRPEIRVA